MPTISTREISSNNRLSSEFVLSFGVCDESREDDQEHELGHLSDPEWHRSDPDLKMGRSESASNNRLRISKVDGNHLRDTLLFHGYSVEL
jgi:hypothetical protein